MSILELDFEDDPQDIIISPDDVFDAAYEKPYIESEHPQRSEGWNKDRNAIFTATGAAKIITTKGKPSTQAGDYMNQLLADWVAGESVDSDGWQAANNDLKNGREREPEARETYEFITGYTVTEKNFCWRDSSKDCGVSPDGEVSQDGGVEIKCVKGKTLIKYKLDGKVPTAYFQQMQCQMWVMGWQWCDFFAYHPQCGHFLIRLERDQVFIDALEKAVKAFNVKFEQKKALL